MEDLDEITQQIENLPDDLYLDDVGEYMPGKKTDWVALGSRRNVRLNRRLKSKQDDLKRDNTDKMLKPGDLNSLENLDVSVRVEEEGVERISEGSAFVKCCLQAKERINKRSELKRVTGQQQFQTERLDSIKPSEDMFDIESKSHFQRLEWNKEDAYGSDGHTKKTSENVKQEEHMSSGYLVRKKDIYNTDRELPAENRIGPSLNDPRLKQSDTPGSEVVDNIYAPARKDPRLVPQQVLTPRQQSNRSRVDPRLKQFDARLGMRKNPRLSSDKVLALQNQSLDLAPPGVEEIADQVPSNEQVCLQMYMYVCMFVCMFIYAYIHSISLGAF